ncbi:hypothetical protein [Alkalihalophilus pseudofirmus]|uniref:hypothetical protein n=1 Tax=Alkalihalophilus pseudofirmus TaxID=79885 RepID=UPI001EE3FC13|nr:hypothetical protein [Alkalihalophilus pseudofirmus]
MAACGNTSNVNQGSQGHNLINSEFSIEEHVKYAERLQDERGLTKEDADEEAFRVQLNEVAVINRAIDVGINVSEEEAFQKSQETREDLENEEAENVKEVLIGIQEEIEQLGISEDDYWNEYMLSSYAHAVMREKLMEYEQNENPMKNWNELQQEIIEEFTVSQSQQINEFKREIGMR